MVLPLLATKLIFPPARSDLVPRPRLAQKLASGLQKPLTLVSAPVGYGKTTLISEWRSGPGRNYPAAWISLDRGDSEPARFLAYLLAALDRIESGLARESTALLRSAQGPPIEAVLTTLINEINRFDRDFVLVLDDCHVITEPEVFKALAFLLDHRPDTFHLALLSRSDPPLSLARLRARNEMLEIREPDLRFSAAEIETFFRRFFTANLSSEDLAVLETRTEGWVAGLQLAALSAQGESDLHAFVQKFSGGHHYVVDYMVEEVLNRQPEHVRSFLLQTAVLERMNAPLCNALTGRSDSQNMLENLDQSNLFVVPLDYERQWYRYHHFFSDLLRNRLAHTATEKAADLHLRASRWYQTNGFIAEAFEHALSGEHYQEAAGVIEQAGNRMLAEGAWGQLLTWLQALPLGTIRSRPALAISYAWGLLMTGQLEAVDQRLEDIETAIEGQESSSLEETRHLRWQSLALRSRSAYLRGDFQQAIDIAGKVLDMLDASDTAARAILGITLGSSHLLAGNLAEASRILEKTQKDSKQAGALTFAIDAAGALAQIREAQGYLRAAAMTYENILHMSEGRIDPNVMAANLNLGNVLFEWNDLKGAEARYQACLEIAEKINSPDGILYAFLGLARTRQALGDPEAAADYVRKAEQARAGFAGSFLEAHSAAILARIALNRGDLESAARWSADQSPSQGDISASNFFLRREEYLAMARLLLQQGRPAEAENYLSQILRTAEMTGLTGVLVEGQAITALALQQQGQETSARAAIAAALEFAEEQGHMRTFIEFGEPIAELLQKAGGEAGKPYTNKILKAIYAGETHSPTVELIEPLSKRELEVLDLLATGKSNRQIAASLYLAKGTVKKHLNNIYGKLGVNNRTACVRRAQELQLIPPPPAPK